jgi:hypothetical protein
MLQFEISTGVEEALYNSMNWLVRLFPVLKRTSLILTGEAFLTLCLTVSTRTVLVLKLVHLTRPVKTPPSVIAGEVTLKVALTVAPGAIGPS